MTHSWATQAGERYLQQKIKVRGGVHASSNPSGKDCSNTGPLLPRHGHALAVPQIKLPRVPRSRTENSEKAYFLTDTFTLRHGIERAHTALSLSLPPTGSSTSFPRPNKKKDENNAINTGTLMNVESTVVSGLFFAR